MSKLALVGDTLIKQFTTFTNFVSKKYRWLQAKAMFWVRYQNMFWELSFCHFVLLKCTCLNELFIEWKYPWVVPLGMSHSQFVRFPKFRTINDIHKESFLLEFFKWEHYPSIWYLKTSIGWIKNWVLCFQWMFKE